MAARAYSKFDNALPVRNFATMIGDAGQSSDRLDLRSAALRNSSSVAHAPQHIKYAFKPEVVAAPVFRAVDPLPLPPLPVTAEVPRTFSKPTTPALETVDLPPSLRAKELDWQRRQQALVTTTNWRLPSGSLVMAWNVVPVQLFQGDLGRFLVMACDFHAYGPANTMLLPSMPAGAQQLCLPRHPLVVSEKHLQTSLQHITALRDRVAAEHRRANIALQNGDLSQIFARTDSKARYCKELSKIVETIASAELGTDVLKTHRLQFEAFIAAM
jgi:hypothetical protein